MQAMAVDSNAGAQLSKPYRFGYHGKGGDFFLLMLKNILLTLVTLGIYAAWAKTRRRQFIWSSIEFDGHRLEYTGTGSELFRGYLKVGAVFVVYGLLTFLSKELGSAGVLLQAVFGLALLGIIPFAIYWSRAYLLSRTRWRGIRFHLSGSAVPFAKAFWIGTLLTIVTIGLYGPVMSSRMHRIITNNTHVGTQALVYQGTDGEYWRIAIKGILLTIVTLGFYSFWLRARLDRFMMENTRFGQAGGRFTLTGGDILGLSLLNVFGTTLTLGIAFAWIACYSLKRLFENISFEGQIDFTKILAAPASGNPAAEGLADALDVGLGI